MSASKENKYEVGDVVRLISGGPDMAVISVPTDDYEVQDLPGEEPRVFAGECVYGCTWFSGKKKEEGEFPEEVLELVRAKKP